MSSSPVLDVVYKEKMSQEELLRDIPEFHGLVVRSASKVSAKIIEAGKNLKIIARAGVGTDNIDIQTARKNGILVINAPVGNAVSAAELTFAMMLSLARCIPQASKSMSEGMWEKKKFKGMELAGKTLGIIGFGRIGQEVACRATAFRMTILVCDPNLSPMKIKELGGEASDLEKICRESDFITIHAPLNKDTENLISSKEMAMMKPSVRIINCARGGIINEEDLAAALKSGRIAGAALDVFTKEPFDSSIFRDVSNCIMTPHLGASTAEAQDAVAREVGVSVVKFFSEGISGCL
jgi:D-3-phosphoglycerate dehydrogenase